MRKRQSRPAEPDPDDTPEERIFGDDPKQGEEPGSSLERERPEEFFDVGGS